MGWKMIYDKEHYEQVLAVARSYRNDVERLEQQLAITEKALELACKTIKEICGKPLWIGGNVPTPETKDSEYFKDLAKERLENE